MPHLPSLAAQERPIAARESAIYDCTATQDSATGAFNGSWQALNDGWTWTIGDLMAVLVDGKWIERLERVVANQEIEQDKELVKPEPCGRWHEPHPENDGSAAPSIPHQHVQGWDEVDDKGQSEYKELAPGGDAHDLIRQTPPVSWRGNPRMHAWTHARTHARARASTQMCTCAATHA